MPNHTLAAKSQALELKKEASPAKQSSQRRKKQRTAMATLEELAQDEAAHPWSKTGPSRAPLVGAFFVQTPTFPNQTQAKSQPQLARLSPGKAEPSPPKAKEPSSLPTFKPLAQHLNYKSSYDQRIRMSPIKQNPLLKQKNPNESLKPKE